jgi:hypothetical protein
VKAIVQDTYGSAAVLETRDIGKPEIGEAEVLVRGRAGAPSASARSVASSGPVSSGACRATPGIP